MPRVRNGFSDPIDFCKKHMPSEAAAKRRYGAGEGPDNRGNCFVYDDDHPPYEDETYRCQTCNKLLGEKDN